MLKMHAGKHKYLYKLSVIIVLFLTKTGMCKLILVKLPSINQ